MDELRAGMSGHGAEALWRSLSTEQLLAELRARADDDASDLRPPCGSSQQLEAYDTPLHVGALILILVVSTLFCAIPLLSSRSKGSAAGGGGRKQSTAIFLCQHFGTGVLLATAFVHLLPTAFVSLTNPCLPSFFSEAYTPLAGLIAMIAALAVISLESYLATRGARHTHSHDLWEAVGDAEEEHDHVEMAMNKLPRNSGLAARRDTSRRPRHIPLDDIEASEGLVAGVSPLPESTPTSTVNGGEHRSNGTPGGAAGKVRKSVDDEDRESDDDLEIELFELEGIPEEHGDDDHVVHLHRSQPTSSYGRSGLPSAAGPHTITPEEQQRLLLQCLLLEAGILFHSIFIGMALSVATGPPFAVFLAAIAVHQSFEGLALGSRIAALQLPRSSLRPWLMVLAFGTTTPIGQAIGLMVHNFYDPLSRTGLLMVGFMNAISAGLLLFAGLVQLLAEDFLSERSYKILRGRRRVHAHLAVLGGAGLMAAVGALA